MNLTLVWYKNTIRNYRVWSVTSFNASSVSNGESGSRIPVDGRLTNKVLVTEWFRKAPHTDPNPPCSNLLSDACAYSGKSELLSCPSNFPSAGSAVARHRCYRNIGRFSRFGIRRISSPFPSPPLPSHSFPSRNCK